VSYGMTLCEAAYCRQIAWMTARWSSATPGPVCALAAVPAINQSNAAARLAHQQARLQQEFRRAAHDAANCGIRCACPRRRTLLGVSFLQEAEQ
jgi:hypothetical protein